MSERLTDVTTAFSIRAGKACRMDVPARMDEDRGRFPCRILQADIVDRNARGNALLGTIVPWGETESAHIAATSARKIANVGQTAEWCWSCRKASIWLGGPANCVPSRERA